MPTPSPIIVARVGPLVGMATDVPEQADQADSADAEPERRR